MVTTPVAFIGEQSWFGRQSVPEFVRMVKMVVMDEADVLLAGSFEKADSAVRVPSVF